MSHHSVVVTLAGFRRAAALTQAEVAERVGVTRQAIAAWESGSRQPSAAQIYALARALRLSVHDLMRHCGLQ